MRHSRKLRLLTLVLSLFVCAAAAEAAPRWKYLGSRTVKKGLDRDTITVTGLRGDFRRIKLKVSRTPVDFHRVVVHYRNGETEEIEVRQRIRAGGETRAIDLRGGERVIRRVEFWYDSHTIIGRRGIVTLFGWG